jgi:peptidoglycan/LPS O-acetylase OafA/YrhL
MNLSVQHKFFRRVDAIDILRAIAVLGVVANHAMGLNGGFLGVDIFFVVSGYVITLLLLKEVSQGEFSFCDFYHHRIARIIPPLLIVSLFIYICTDLLFWIPEDYEFVTRSFAYQALFVQNIFFAERAADYFQGLTTAKLNLHLWSLAVEEQFYIIYPFFFLVSYKYRNRRWMQFLILFALAFSLVLLTGFFENNVAAPLAKILQFPLAEVNAKAMRYYLLPTRAWELLLGAMSCIIAWRLHTIIQNRRLSFSQDPIQMLSMLCFTAIMVSMILVKETMAWPNHLAFIPLVSTGILLILFSLFGDNALYSSCNNSFLSLIGRSSYSLYLWHWPILGILIYTNSDFGGSFLDYVVYAGLISLFTAFTYLAIEKPRKYIKKYQSTFVLLVFVCFSLYVGSKSRSPEDFPKDIKSIIETGSYAEKCYTCTHDPNGEFIVLWGDSHSQMLLNSVRKSATDLGLELVHIRGSLADQHTRLLHLTKKPGYRGALLAARWSMYAVGFPADDPEEKGDRFLVLNGKKAENSSEATVFFKAHLTRLLSIFPSNKPVMIVKEVPRYSFMPKKEAIMENIGLRLRPLPVKTLQAHKDEQQVMSEIFNDAANNFRNVELAEPAKLLCKNEKCMWRDGWSLLYKDDDHLSIYGAEWLQPLFQPFMLSVRHDN